MIPNRTRVPPIVFVFAAVACLGVASAIFESTLNNYLHEVFHLTEDERGGLEFPRELPGFLTAVFAGALLFLPEARMAVIATAALGLGLFGLAQVHMGYWHMLLWLFIWSCGAHLMMPLETALAIQLSKKGRAGTRLGQLGLVRSLGVPLGALLVWKVFARFYAEPFRVAFFCAGGAAVIAAIMLANVPRLKSHSRELTRFVFHKRYSLFYVLCVLFGARKQVFITFGPWVLVKVFRAPTQIIAELWFYAGLVGIVFKPLLGRMIDRFGERVVLMADGLVLMAVCFGYAFAEALFDRSVALHVLYCCFVIDNLMFAVGMARHTYASKIARDPREVTPTFSLGITINHAVSMTVPWLGGLLWLACGYQIVFMVAAGVAFLTIVTASLIRVPREPDEPTPAPQS